MFRGDSLYELQSRIEAKALVSGLSDEEKVNKVKDDFEASEVFEGVFEESPEYENNADDTQGDITFFT